MINILLVDDQALLCEVLKTWLDVEQDIQVLGVAHNGQEALTAVETLQPDIVLMDIDMPQMDGLKATKIIAQRFPKVKVIFLSGHDDDLYLGKSLRAGAKGYLLKNTTADELVQKIRSVYDNVNLLETIDNKSSLAPLQIQLEELIETYRLKFENIIESHDNSVNINSWKHIEQQLEQRLDELENQAETNLIDKINELEYRNQSSWKSIRKELLNINSQFNQANRNLSMQFNQQISNLKQDLDLKLSNALDDWSRQRAALQEWAVQRDEMRPSLEDYEAKNHQEIEAAVNPIRNSHSDLNQQIRKMRNWLLVSGLLTLLALTVSGYAIMLQVNSRNSLIVPNRDVVN
ncbi:MAG: response regulator [Cyanobacteria bacterium P01_A01_bin.83]